MKPKLVLTGRHYPLVWMRSEDGLWFESNNYGPPVPVLVIKNHAYEYRVQYQTEAQK